MLLGVNIDHIATLRQARNTIYPDLLKAAEIVKDSGGDSITIHLREDRRHIQDNDVWLLKEKNLLPLNLEMALTKEMLSIATEVKPDFCCIVPEKREELTTEGGLDIKQHQKNIFSACERLSAAGIRVSLFIDPDKKQIEMASETGATYVELHTGNYADASSKEQQAVELDRLHDAVMLASSLKLKVNAGHGLNYNNIQNIASIPNVLELNIGHSIISRAIYVGLSNAIKEIKQLIEVVSMY